jgi:hypothetical protein
LASAVVQVAGYLAAFVILHSQKLLGKILKFGGAIQNYGFQLCMRKRQLPRVLGVYPHKILLGVVGRKSL